MPSSGTRSDNWFVAERHFPKLVDKSKRGVSGFHHLAIEGRDSSSYDSDGSEGSDWDEESLVVQVTATIGLLC